MNRCKKWLIETFGFKNQEAQSFLIFALFSIVLFILSILPKKAFLNNASYSQIEVKFEALKEASQDIKLSEIKSSLPDELDPNQMDFYDWKYFNLEFPLINRIISYRLNGGYFNDVADLKKIYGLNDSIYRELSTLKVEKKKIQKRIEYTSSKFKSEFPTRRSDKSANRKIERIFINSCDSIDILKLPGIGPVRSARIIKYRNLLGGYISKDQFANIYGLDSLSLNSLIEHSIIDLKGISKIPINSIQVEDLCKHPYFDTRLSKQVINYRNQHGNYSNPLDLLKIKTIDTAFVHDVKAYLSFD